MTTAEGILAGYAGFLTFAMCGYALWAMKYVAKFERRAKAAQQLATEWEYVAGQWQTNYNDLRDRAYMRDAKGRIAKAADVLP